MRRWLTALVAVGCLAFGAEAAQAVPSVSISDPTTGEANGTLSFVVSLSEESQEPITLQYRVDAGTAKTPDDYTHTVSPVTIPADRSTASINVSIANDAMDEFDETLSITLESVTSGSATIGKSTGIGTIADDDAPPTVSVVDALPTQPVSEPNGFQTLNFVVKLSARSGKPVHVDYTTRNPAAAVGEGTERLAPAVACANPQCTLPAEGDYRPVRGTLTFLPTETVTEKSVPFVYAVGDSLDENRYVELAISSRTHLQRQQATFTAADVGKDVTVGGQANEIVEFVSATEVVLQTPMTNATGVSFTIEGNPTTFTDGTLIGGTNQTLADPLGVGKILSQGPLASIAGATVNEGAAGTTSTANLTVTLDNAAPQTLSMGYETSDGSAKSPGDYQAVASGQRLVFQKDQKTATISIPIKGNDVNESDKAFTVRLKEPSNVRLPTNPTAIVSIKNDDPTPGIVAPDVTVGEPRSGTAAAVVNVSLSAPSARTLTATYDTRDGSAVAGTNYGRTTGTLTFTPGQTSKQIEIPVAGDGQVTENLDFTLGIQNTADGGGEVPVRVVITDSDLTADTLPALSINDASVQHRGSEPGTAVFTVRLDRPLNRQVRVDYATADGSATAPEDYTSVAGTLAFAPGETTHTISVPVTGGTVPRFNESFSVVLSNAVNASIARGNGQGIIINAVAQSLPFSVSGRSVRATSVLCRRGRRCIGQLVRWTAPATGRVTVRYTALVPTSRGRTRRLVMVQKSYRVRRGTRRVRIKRAPGTTTARILRTLRTSKARRVVVTVTFTDRFGAQRLSRRELPLRY